jgi:glycyl-tRNA synthetase
MADTDLLSTLASLCKRRGFIFQSSEIYGGLKSAYDYGPLGIELKRNIAAAWWKTMVSQREDVYGLESAIMMHPNVWRASGHVAGFADPLVDCLNCKERFRPDKTPKVAPGTPVEYRVGGRKDGEVKQGAVPSRGYVCPVCSSPELSEERMFNQMFRTSIGPVDVMETFFSSVQEAVSQGASFSRQQLREMYEEAVGNSVIYLRPETAQGMFVQFLNVVQSTAAKVPFGIAQQGKSFRNEIKSERLIFRTCEFEQMEMEFFVEPGTQREWHTYWVEQRLGWWRGLANNGDFFRARDYDKSELAHYADACVDIEYQYPWGWDELEGIASRTDYDLRRHTEDSGNKLTYFDPQKNDPETGKPGWRYTPYVIEPAAGLTRGLLCLLLDAYTEETGVDADGQEKTRVLLKLHPSLAPIKVGVLPLVKKDGLPEAARQIVSTFFKAGISAKYDEQQSIGKRYAKHDEVGTPYCLTVDHETTQNGTVTIRDRDTTRQERIPAERALEIVQKRIQGEA